MKKIWPFSFYFLYFAAIASYSPYMVLYYQSVGLSGTQIGLLTGITPLITLVSVPFWTGLADTTGRHRLIMSMAMLVGVTALILLPFLDTFVLIFGLGIILQTFFSPVMAFSASAAMFMLGAQKDLYGRIRLGGTIGFGLTATLAGILVENNGLKMAFFCGAFLLFLGFLVSLKLEHGNAATDRAVSRRQIVQLLRNPHWLIFLVLAFTSGMAFAASNTYFFPFMKELGATEGTMGLALTIGTLSVIPALLLANRMIVRFNSYGLMVLSLAVTGLRLLLFAVSFNPTFVLFVQILNGLSQPIMGVAGVSYADEHAPEGLRTTAQGLFTAMVSGIGAAAGGFIGGLLLASLGGRGLYMIFGSAVFVILLLITLIRAKLLPEQNLSSTGVS